MKLNKEQIIGIEEKRKSGMTNSQIAQNLQVSVGTIVRWVKRLRDSGREVPKRKPGFAKLEL